MGLTVSDAVRVFLMPYKLGDSGKHGLIVFVRTGAHADLFE
jgi:mRNA interferase YafQ